MSSYKDFKNHLHNTLGITKQQIREMTDKAVYKIVERRVEIMLRDVMSLDRIVDDAIRNRTFSLWGESEDSLDDRIKKEIVAQLLDGVKLKVEIAKTKRESTPHRTLRTVVRSNKKRSKS